MPAMDIHEAMAHIERLCSMCDGYTNEAWLTVRRFVVANQGKGMVGEGPCRHFSRERILIGKNADGEDHYREVPWCNHGESQKS